MSVHLNRLSKREQEIIIETYVSDTPKTLLELSKRFGVSRERIRQIRDAALTRLRAFSDDEFDMIVCQLGVIFFPTSTLHTAKRHGF